MNSPSPTSRTRAFWNAVTIVCFAGLLWLPTLDYFFKLDHARASDENRLPARSPRFQGVGQMQAFISEVEAYFNDHFGFPQTARALEQSLEGPTLSRPGE